MSFQVTPGHPANPYPNSLALLRSPVVVPSQAKFSIPEMVAARAASAPHAAAVVSDNEILTYGELDQRANLWANRLIELGVIAETIVAICLDRSLQSLVSSLAVL